MDTHVLAAADAVARSPLPDVPALNGVARLMSLVEGILFWGILGFGLVFPFLAAAYAYLKA